MKFLLVGAVQPPSAATLEVPRGEGNRGRMAVELLKGFALPVIS